MCHNLSQTYSTHKFSLQINLVIVIVNYYVHTCTYVIYTTAKAHIKDRMDGHYSAYIKFGDRAPTRLTKTTNINAAWMNIMAIHATNAKLKKIRQYLILPDFGQNRQIFCTPIFTVCLLQHISRIIHILFCMHDFITVTGTYKRFTLSPLSLIFTTCL